MTATTFGNFLVIQKVTLKNSFSSSLFNVIHHYTVIIALLPWKPPWLIKILKSFVAIKRVSLKNTESEVEQLMLKWPVSIVAAFNDLLTIQKKEKYSW